MPSPARPRPLRRTLATSTVEGMFAEVVAACSGGAVLTGWALHLGCVPLQVGVLGSLGFLAQLVQLPAAWLTSALGRRRVAIAAVTASRQALLPLALLPFLPLSPEGRRAMLLAVAAASAALGVLGNNAWTAWMGEVVPPRLRGRYFGQRTAWCTLGGTVASLAAGVALDRAGRSEATGIALAALALVACAAGAATSVLLARQHDVPSLAAPRADLAASLRPLRDPAARTVLAYQIAWNGAVAFGGGMFTFHLLRNLNAGYTRVALHGTGVALARILSAPLWGRAVDRLGARPVLAACSFVIGLMPLLWILPTESCLWPIAFDAAVGGAAWGGHQLASFALPLSIAPREGRPFYLATFSLAGGVAYAVAAAAGGAVAGLLPVRLVLLGRPAFGVEALFLASAAARLAAGPLSLRIRERGAGTVTELQALARRGVATLRGRVADALRVA